MKKMLLLVTCALFALVGCRVVEVQNHGEEVARDADGKPVLLQDGSIQTVKKGWEIYHNQHWMTTRADSLSASIKKDEISFSLNGLNTEPSSNLVALVDTSLSGIALLTEKVAAAIVTAGGSTASDAVKSAIATAIKNYVNNGGDTAKATVECKDGDCVITDGSVTEVCEDCVVK